MLYIVNYFIIKNIIVMFSFQRPTKGMAALVEEGLKHRQKHQPIEKDITKPFSVEARLEYNVPGLLN